MNKTIFIATVLAATTLLAAGFVVFPGSIKEVQADPCSIQGGGGGSNTETECDFEGIGILVINEGSDLTGAPIILPTP